MRVALLMLMLVSALSFAEEMAPKNATGSGDGVGIVKSWLNGERPVPVESEFVTPKISALQQWADFNVPQAGAKTQFQLALDSITVGPDEIVRYVVAVKPKAGNVTTLVFEGIDCASNQYRRYANATSKDAEWRQSNKKEWQLISKNGHNAWQGYLADDFCRFSAPWAVETIKKSFGVAKFMGDCAVCSGQ
ncbi:hypothetical protein HZU75_09000 [Chitinibacter fontanus]|uniref:CNP1-like uncharacterized domain-containing protein n=1 Tax=Chitinibacter fontanus TaxID=1737446 RepID=A0A7D5V9X8_9NEIS|nr:CNP1-like family protein [Chitinibacter fontanus]QLI81658.1 hypothetical protein HZU75_09000 [Chitinibacter fontanus]